MARPARGARLGDMWPLRFPEFRSKPRPQLPNRHRLAVDADPITGIRFGALLELVDENDVTGTPPFIKPHPDIRAGGPSRHLRLLSSSASKCARADRCGIRHPVSHLIPPPKRLESMKGFFVSEAKW